MLAGVSLIYLITFFVHLITRRCTKITIYYITHAWWGGMCDRRCAWKGGMHAERGVVHGRGVCMVGGMHGREHVW